MFPIDEPGRQFREVLDRTMAWSELGSGPPVVFPHGSPVSSYDWRNIMRMRLDMETHTREV
jgi:pimeloyl-ACP methyl ester carboxylesterase